MESLVAKSSKLARFDSKNTTYLLKQQRKLNLDLREALQSPEIGPAVLGEPRPGSEER